MLRAAINPASSVGAYSSNVLASVSTRKICNCLFPEVNFSHYFKRANTFFASVANPLLPKFVRVAVVASGGLAYKNRSEEPGKMMKAIELACKEGTKQYLKDKEAFDEEESLPARVPEKKEEDVVVSLVERSVIKSFGS